MGRRAVLALSALLAGCALGSALAAQLPPPSTTDARIEYYKERLGGPGTFPHYARLGAAYIQKARETGRLEYYSEAERHLRRSLEFQPNFEALLWLGVALLNQHRFREALPHAREAVETLPASVEAQGALFDIYLALGNEQEADAVLLTLRDLQAGFAASARTAALQQYQGNTSAALKSMEEACAQAEAESAPAEAQAWCLVRLGSLHLAACDLDSADAAYQKALKEYPEYPLAVEHLAELRAAQGHTAEALSLFRKLLAANPDPQLLLTLADLLESSGEPPGADADPSRALADMQESVGRGENGYLRPLALRMLSEPETAREGLRLAKQDWENRQDVFAADTLAWAYYVNGQREDARQLLDKALRSGTREPAVLLHAAEIYRAEGDAESASRALAPLRSCPAALQPQDRVTLEKLWAAVESLRTK